MRELRKSLKISLEDALLAATPEETLRETGRVAFTEAIINGSPVHDTLVLVLDQVAATADTWQEAVRLFYEQLKAQEKLIRIEALKEALSTLTDDEAQILYAEEKFNEDISNDVSVEEAFAARLNELVDDDVLWVQAEEIFYDVIDELEYPEEIVNVEEEDEEDEEDNKPSIAEKVMKVVAITIGVAMIAVLVFVIGSAWLNSRVAEPPIAEVPATTEAPETTEAPVPNRDEAIVKAMNIMTSAGWKPGEFIIDTVDGQVDASTTGNGAFTNENIKSPSAMVTFLKSGTDAANALLAKLIKDTDATREEVLNDLNWVAVQSNVPFTYPGNTGFKKGEIIDTGSRNGDKGDIFLLFVAPNSDKSQAVRGACANPQTVVPEPKLESKSPNPDDYAHPDGKPTVPPVDTTAETTPPVVDKLVPGPSGVVDRPTKDPGTESGVTAPGAIPAVEDRADDVQAPEPKVNPGPSNDGVNVGDPGNPF